MDTQQYEFQQAEFDLMRPEEQIAAWLKKCPECVDAIKRKLVQKYGLSVVQRGFELAGRKYA